jgi:hypothetical protein
MAVGATARDVLLLVIRQGMLLAAAGFWRRSVWWAFRPSGRSPRWSTTSVTAGLCSVESRVVVLIAALAATYVPARRAAQTDNRRLAGEHG